MTPNEQARTLKIIAAAVQKRGKVYRGLRHGLIIPQVFEETGERVTSAEGKEKAE